jgi:hypothetical protein
MVINAAMTLDQPTSEDGQNWQFCAADRGDLATLKAAQIRQAYGATDDITPGAGLPSGVLEQDPEPCAIQPDRGAPASGSAGARRPHG